MGVPDFEIETIRRVVDNTGKLDGIEVKPDSDGLGLVELVCLETGSSYLMNPEQARLVAKAMALCADELDSANAS